MTLIGKIEVLQVVLGSLLTRRRSLLSVDVGLVNFSTLVLAHNFEK